MPLIKISIPMRISVTPPIIVAALTKEPIDAAAKAKNEAAIKEVLPPAAAAIEEERTVDFEGASYTYNLAYDEQGNTVGWRRWFVFFEVLYLFHHLAKDLRGILWRIAILN